MHPTTTKHVSLLAVIFWLLVLAGAWQALHDRLHRADQFLYNRLGHALCPWAESDYPQLLAPGEAVAMEPVVSQTRLRECPPVGMVELNESACAEVFAALPLGPQDTAVLLNKLKQGGATTVGLSSPLIWPGEQGDMVREMLCRVLAGFPHSAVGLRGRTAAQPDFTPAMLRHASIPQENIEGNPSGLPIANRPLPNGLTETPDALAVVWAPDWLEGEPHTQNPSAVDSISFPLLMRWNGETIPTLPFRLALARLGLDGKDVKVRLGKDITYGGFTLPIDDNSRTRLTEARVVSIPLADVVSGTDLTRQLGKRPCVMLEQPADKQNTPLRLERLARTLSQLAGTEKIITHTSQRPCGGQVLRQIPLLPDWQSRTTACFILLVFLWVMPFIPGLLRWLILLALPGVIIWQSSVYIQQGQWFTSSALLAWWLLLAIVFLLHRTYDKGLFGKRR
ncbi:MAG: hypothetical protein IKA55_00815 [Akkermansia sp.]|nr:hypothetical protein [Akkermansia sp.]